MKKLQTIIDRFLGRQLSDKEKLEIVLKEEKYKNFLEDIKHIRTEGYYQPDYNKKPSFTEYKLSYKDGIVGWEPKLVCSPREKFSRVEEWREAIRQELKLIERKKQVGKQYILFLDSSL